MSKTALQKRLVRQKNHRNSEEVREEIRDIWGNLVRIQARLLLIQSFVDEKFREGEDVANYGISVLLEDILELLDPEISALDDLTISSLWGDLQKEGGRIHA